jgi:hypothetical protein
VIREVISNTQPTETAQQAAERIAKMVDDRYPGIAEE